MRKTEQAALHFQRLVAGERTASAGTAPPLAQRRVEVGR
jgi:hypothetical protein